jgi:hypothetical protein
MSPSVFDVVTLLNDIPEEGLHAGDGMHKQEVVRFLPRREIRPNGWLGKSGRACKFALSLSQQPARL